MNYRFYLSLLIIVIFFSSVIMIVSKNEIIKNSINNDYNLNKDIKDKLDYCNFKGYSNYIINDLNNSNKRFICYNLINNSLNLLKVNLSDYKLYLNIRNNAKIEQEKEKIIS